MYQIFLIQAPEGHNLRAIKRLALGNNRPTVTTGQATRDTQMHPGVAIKGRKRVSVEQDSIDEARMDEPPVPLGLH